MIKLSRAAPLIAAILVACATRQHAPVVARPAIIAHEQWQATPPLGYAADATRRNIGASGSLGFHDLKIDVLSTAVDSTSSPPGDVVKLRLTLRGASEERLVREGTAFNWRGFHIAAVAIYGPKELGAGLVALEVATVASLPPHIATATTAGGADMRLRIPHRISHVTLHHTGDSRPLLPGDDPVQRLRGLQAWGASDRNWWDLPYHFLMDLQGKIYEGRDYHFMGETNTAYDPGGHFLISIIGNYERQEPTQAQLDAIADLMAWALREFDLPLDKIGGHYNYATTSCPGTHLRKFLEDGTLRRMVAARLNIDTTTHPVPAAAPAFDTTSGPPPVEREFRGVWVAAVGNLDWPSRSDLPVDSQKAELIRLLDRTKQLGMNAFILHVRPAGDALYESELEPWSEFLTGTQGKAPEPFYDPLEFAVREAHARGLELHAWFNPYRARHPAARSELAATHIGKTHPELVKPYGSFLWMDPGEDVVRDRTVEVIADVTRRYDVDGVHIDDYFYPYRERGADGKDLDFPDSVSYAKYLASGGTLGRSDWRRNNVDRFVKQMYQAVKQVKPWVKVGVSPIGTWRPGVTPQLRGFDAYESIYADSRKWFMDGDLDYFVPQLYWPIARPDVSFPLLLDWWTKQNLKNRALYAGLFTSSVNATGWPADEVTGQIYIARAQDGAHGHVHFSMRSLLSEGAFRPVAGADTLAQAKLDSIHAVQARTQARRDTMTTKLMRDTYARPALIPAMPWLDNQAPAAPTATLQQLGNRTTVTLTLARGEPAYLWVVQSKWPSGAWRTEIVPTSQPRWSISAPAAESGAPVDVWVSVVDRAGNQSRAVRPQRD